MMRHWIWVAALAAAACGPGKRDHAADHAAREAALAAGVAARQAQPSLPAPSPEATAMLPPPPGMPPTPVELTRLACEDGLERTLRYFPEQGIAILMPDGVGREMQMEPVASGVRYAGAGTVVTGEGTRYLIARDGADPIACTAAG